MQTYDIVHHGWALNETPIHEIDLQNKLEKWGRLIQPLEVVESEVSYQRPARSRRPHDAAKQIQEQTGTAIS
jgi:hypothetical protein